MSYPTEEEVLLRWRDLVLETDPDIIIGCGARPTCCAASSLVLCVPVDSTYKTL